MKSKVNSGEAADGVGPSLDGIFSQSNFGVVTKMGFNLFPWPETVRQIRLATRN